VEDLDIVSNYGWIKSGKWDDVEAEFKAITEVVGLMIETAKGCCKVKGAGGIHDQAAFFHTY